MSVCARRSKGLTLIELVVVMMVLIALASILVPQLTGFVNRGHTSSASTNIGEIQKAISLYEVKYLGGYPSDYELPIDTAGSVPAYIAGNSDKITPTPLTAVQATSLSSAGITRAFNLKASFSPGESKTFDAASTTAVTYGPAAIGTNCVAVLDNTWAKQQLGVKILATPTEVYVVFGIGRDCTLIGKGVGEAPLHFDQADPKDVYSRYFAVYAIPTATDTVGFKARLVGVLGAEFTGLGEHLSEYFSKDSQ